MSPRLTARIRGKLAFVWGVGLLVCGAGFLVSQFALGRQRRAQAQRDADKLAATLQTGLATPIESLHAMAAFLEAVDERGTSLAQFQAVARPFVARHKELVALEWLPKVPESERAAFEAMLRDEQPGYGMREPTRAGDMVPAVPRAVHVALAYAEPLNPFVSGLDVAFDPQRTGPVWRALEQGIVTVSDRYQLVEDPDGVYSIVGYAPVRDAPWHRGVPPGSRSGVVVGLFRLAPLFATALAGSDLRGVSYQVRDPAAPPPLQVLLTHGTLDPSLVFSSRVRFIDRTYDVQTTPPLRPIGATPWFVAGGVLLATALLAGTLTLAERAKNLEKRLAKLGQYTIEYEIARGGMGTVYRARHSLLRRPTAIKVSHGASAQSFHREALLTCALTHPNTVQLYDFGTGEDGTLYLAMEYVDGFHLEELVEVGGPVPPGRAVRILLQVAGSLTEAHERGIIHRDVKPRNIMLTERGGMHDFVKVLDLGLARSHAAVLGELPAPGVFEGTPGYAAPEVIRGAPADVRSDAFALGCVGYFLLTGQAPFGTGSQAAILSRTLSSEPEPLPASVPPALCALIAACLRKQPGGRPASMHVVTGELRKALAECPSWTNEDVERWWRDHPPPEHRAPLDRPEAFSVVWSEVKSGTSHVRVARESRQKAQGSS